MIDVISMQEVRDLAEACGAPLVSIYLPTHTAGAETGQNAIRFKNLLGRAGHHVLSVGASVDEMDALLSPLTGLVDDPAFRIRPGRGLAVFVGGDATRTYRLPDESEELVVVADRFHVGPLLSCVVADGGFHVLALGQNRVRLLHGSRASIEELAVDELAGIPASRAEALRFDDREPQLQSHGAVRAGAGRVVARFHGQGMGKDGRDADLERFLHAVDVGVCEFVGDRAEPLVLAGVERNVAVYRQLSRHPYVVAGGISGNADHLRPDELHERAWPLVDPCFDAGRRQAAERVLAHPDRVASTVAAALVAARDGRIESLFVPAGLHRWGRVDGDRHQIEASDEQRPGDRDLFDVVAVDTLLSGGSVFTVDRSEVPGAGPLAAELRY